MIQYDVLLIDAFFSKANRYRGLFETSEKYNCIGLMPFKKLRVSISCGNCGISTGLYRETYTWNNDCFETSFYDGTGIVGYYHRLDNGIYNAYEFNGITLRSYLTCKACKNEMVDVIENDRDFDLYYCVNMRFEPYDCI